MRELIIHVIKNKSSNSPKLTQIHKDEIIVSLNQNLTYFKQKALVGHFHNPFITMQDIFKF